MTLSSPPCTPQAQTVFIGRSCRAGQDLVFSLTVNAGDKEREIPIGNVLRVQAVNRYGRVALKEVFVETLDEAAAIVRVRAIEANDNSL
jgi:hypothetical protein